MYICTNLAAIVVFLINVHSDCPFALEDSYFIHIGVLKHRVYEY